MIAKVELESHSVLPTPEAWRAGGNLGDLDGCPAPCLCASSSSQSPPALGDVEPVDESEDEEKTNMVLNWSGDSKLRQACAKLVSSVNRTLPLKPPCVRHEFTPGDAHDHEDIEILSDWTCESELRNVLVKLMNSECAGPFLEGHSDNVLGLRTIEQRLNDGRYVDVAGQTSAELFWSDIDECLDICVADGRFPTVVRKMRTLAQQSEKDFWNLRDGFKSILHTMSPALRPAVAVAFVAGSKAENCVPAWADLACMRVGQCVCELFDDAVHGLATVTDCLTDTFVTDNGSSVASSLD